MKKRGLVFALAMMLLAGCKKSAPPEGASVAQSSAPSSVTSQSPAPTPSPAAAQSPALQTPSVQPKTAGGEPQFGWKAYDSEAFTVGPSQGRFFVVPMNSTRLRVNLSAKMPVIAGVMNKTAISSKGVVNASHFNTLPCAFMKAAEGDRQCTLDPKVPDVFLLRDSRVDPTQSKTPKLTDNEVKVTLSAWACVANCKPHVSDGR
jgi:hypothetical protein